MKQIVVVLVIALIAILAFSSCNSRSEAKNMEQLYAERGVPVKTEIIESGSFETKLSFNSV